MNQHENLLKREIQRMWTNIKLCLITYVHVYYSFPIQQLLYVCYAYLLITKLLKILIFAHGEHKKKLIRMYSILFYIRIQLVTGARDSDMIATYWRDHFSNLVTCQKMVTTYDAFVVNLRNIVIQIKNNYCWIIR